MSVTYSLIDYGCHYVAENTELKEITEFDTGISSHKHYIFIKVKDETQALERIAHELRQIVVKMLIYKRNVRCQVGWELLQIVKDLPVVLFNQGQELGQFNVSDSRDHEISH